MEAKTKDQIQFILDRIKYKDWELRLLEKGDGFLVQAKFWAKDIISGEFELQFCRKFYVSPYACTSEIVRCVHLAIQQAELHEMNEQFMFDDVAIFDPHTDLQQVAKAFKIGYIIKESRTPKPNK